MSKRIQLLILELRMVANSLVLKGMHYNVRMTQIFTLLSVLQSMSSWYNLFADLDPLQDPDSVGKSAPATTDDGCA